MGQILVRGFEDAILDDLKARAKANKRSAAAEIRMIVEHELHRKNSFALQRSKSILELAGSHPTNRTAQDIVAEIRTLRDEWQY